MTAFLALSVLLIAGCPQPPPTAATPAPTSSVVVEQEPPTDSLLQTAFQAMKRGDLGQARSTLERLFTTYPDHLEGHVLWAVLLQGEGVSKEVAKAWRRVEQILVFRGKQHPFELQPLLFEATRHYLLIKDPERARLFIDELWRRFPTNEWSVKAQFMAAETAYAQKDWSRVIQSCEELVRLRPKHATAGRCTELIRAARRLKALGPEPPSRATRWVWEHPLPQGNTLHDIWQSPEGTIFTVGDAGTILVSQPGGKGFSLLPSPTRWPLRGIWGFTSRSIYVVGAAGIVLHYNGKTWQTLRSPNPQEPDLWGIYVTTKGELVAVGEEGTVVEFRKGQWTRSQISSVHLRSVWGTKDGTFYAVGDGGVLFRQRQGNWASMTSDCYEDLWSIWGSSEKQMVAVGNRRSVVFFDGKRAKEDVMGRSNLRDVWGSDPQQLWAVGTSGEIIRFSAQGWQAERSGTLVDLLSISGRKPTELWAAGNGGTILRRQRNTWTLMAGGLQQELVSVLSGPTVGAATALGELGVLLQRRKGKWLRGKSLPRGTYRDMWMTTGDRLVAIGDKGRMVMQTKKGWSTINTKTFEDLHAVWGWEGGFVAVGTRGTIIRVVGRRVFKDPCPTGLDLHGVWGSSAHSILAVGNRGAILRFNGEVWLEQDSGTLADLYAVWEASPQEAFISGSGGTLLHWAKGRFKRQSSPLSQNIVGLWGGAEDRVFAVSDRGSVIHYDGKAWQLQRSPAECLAAIHGDPATGVLAVGCHGTILRWQP